MKATILKNHFLIATPSLQDTNFSKSVIYLYEHSNNGAMGLVINKPLNINLGSVLRHLDIEILDKSVETEPVLMGGPVSQEHGFVLHDEGDNIIISASKETLRTIAAGEGPKNYLITLGYSGWQAGQLEYELNRNDWLIAPADPAILFTTSLEERWVKAAQLIGVDIHNLSGQVGHA